MNAPNPARAQAVQPSASKSRQRLPDGREVFLEEFGHPRVAGAAGVAAEDVGDGLAAAAVGLAAQVDGLVGVLEERLLWERFGL